MTIANAAQRPGLAQALGGAHANQYFDCQTRRSYGYWTKLDTGRNLAVLRIECLDNAKMAALLGALGFPKQAMELEGEQHLAVTVSEGGPWVFHLPQELRDALAAMPPSQVLGVAERWVSHEELAYDGWSATDVVPLLEMLQQLATNAASEQKSLLLWMSL